MSTDNCDAEIIIAGRTVAVKIQRYARAKSYRLRLDAGAGMLRLSVPKNASLRHVLNWAHSQEDWINKQLNSKTAAIELVPGATLCVEGRAVHLRWAENGRRTPLLDGDFLTIGGPEASFTGRVLRWLKTRALDILAAETYDMAEGAGLTVSRVSVADPRSRWGSCTASGAIRYSWRLIMAPPDVRRAIVAHEVAHLRHLNHSPAFHAFHQELLGEDPGYARIWLRKHGAELHCIKV